jgi:hypothetical protein
MKIPVISLHLLNYKIDMNKFLLISFVTLLGLSFQSCKEEITLNQEFKETPVIYGLLNQSEDLQFIKINRGFIGPGNAFEIAQIPDSSYFKNVSAKVEEVINNQVVYTWELRDTILTTKSTNGLFFSPNYKAYYFSTSSHPLVEGSNYRLTVNIDEGKLEVTAETQLVRNFAPTTAANSGTSLNSTNSNLRFAKSNGEYISTSITCDAGTAAFGNVSLDLQVYEYRGNNDSTLIHIPWNVAETTAKSAFISAVAQGQSFFERIKDGLTNDNTITKRNFFGFEVTFTGGSQELYNYILVNKPSTSLTQSKPSFTNLSVTEGYSVVGIFSARKTTKIFKPFVFQNQTFVRCIDGPTTKSLCTGLIPGLGALFCSQHPGDIMQPYKCD